MFGNGDLDGIFVDIHPDKCVNVITSYSIHYTKLYERLERGAAYVMPGRPPLEAEAREPVWTFEAGSPLWAGPTFADGVVYAGAEDGRLLVVDAQLEPLV